MTNLIVGSVSLALLSTFLQGFLLLGFSLFVDIAMSLIHIIIVLLCL